MYTNTSPGVIYNWSAMQWMCTWYSSNVQLQHSNAHNSNNVQQQRINAHHSSNVHHQRKGLAATKLHGGLATAKHGWMITSGHWKPTKHSTPSTAVSEKSEQSQNQFVRAEEKYQNDHQQKLTVSFNA